MTSKEKTKSLVNKATTDDRNPPSGYLLKELASRTMSIAECQTIEDLMVKKLSKNKPYIKYKALRIVKYLCEAGSPNWRRAWQRNTDKLRDAQQFRGPPDPIYGDAPYQQVRKAAKDAMQAVFQQSTIDSSHIKNRIKGAGSDGNTNNASSSSNQSSYTPSTFASGSTGVYGGRSQHKKDKAPSAPGTGAGNWGKQMPGHGNTSYQPSAKITTFQPLKSSGGYSNPAVLSGVTSHSRGKLDTRGTGNRNKGKAGGIWGDENEVSEDEEEEEEEDYSQYQTSITNEFPASTSSTSARYNPARSTTKKLGSFGGNIKSDRKAKNSSSGQFEQRWVDGIVKSGGVGCRVADLPKFVKQFENLSQSHVLGYLDEKLEDGAWQKQGKALALIEALLGGKSSDDVLDYFTQSPENIQALQNSKKSILRRKANAVIDALELDEDDEESEEEEVSAPVQRQQQQQQPQARDLLDMGGNGNEPESTTSAFGFDIGGGDIKNEDAEDDDEANMFGDCIVHDEEVEDATDLLNMGGSSQQAQGASSGGIMDMMGDVDAVQTQSQNQPKKAEPYNDIFGDLGGNSILDTNNAASGQSGGGGDMLSAFGGNNGQSKSPQQQQPKASPASSAFGFDLGGGNNTQQPTAATQQPTAQASSAFGFDLGAAQTAAPSQQQQQPMMTASMMQQNAAQMQQMQQMQQMMAQMNMNPQMMNPQMMAMMQQQMQMNMQQQQNQMNPMMQNRQQQQQQPNLFQQTLAGVGGAQPQRPAQTYGHDPFAQMMSGGGAQAAPVAESRPKKSGPDPFADLSLGSMK